MSQFGDLDIFPDLSVHRMNGGSAPDGLGEPTQLTHVQPPALSGALSGWPQVGLLSHPCSEIGSPSFHAYNGVAEQLVRM